MATTADDPGQSPARGWMGVARGVWAAMKTSHTQLLAAGVAFWGFLSVFPASVAAISAFGLVMRPEEVADRAEGLLDAVPEESRDLVESQLRSVAEGSGTALGIGVVVSIALALWAASTAMANLVEAVNAAYGLTDRRGLVRKRGLALGLMAGALVFVGITLAGIAALPAVVAGTELVGAVRILVSLAVWPILAVGFLLAVGVVYHVAPDRPRPPWRWASWGAVVALVVWVVASIVFQIYTANFGSYQETYGTLAAAVILLLWLMLSSLAVLVGAHVDAHLEADAARRAGAEPVPGAAEGPGDR